MHIRSLLCASPLGRILFEEEQHLSCPFLFASKFTSVHFGTHVLVPHRDRSSYNTKAMPNRQTIQDEIANGI